FSSISNTSKVYKVCYAAMLSSHLSVTTLQSATRRMPSSMGVIEEKESVVTAQKESAPGYAVHFTEVQEMPGGRLARDGKGRRDPAAKARRVQDLRGDLRGPGRELGDGLQGSSPARGVRRRVPPHRAVQASCPR